MSDILFQPAVTSFFKTHVVGVWAGLTIALTAALWLPSYLKTRKRKR
jgi:hypothetical protein